MSLFSYSKNLVQKPEASGISKTQKKRELFLPACVLGPRKTHRNKQTE
jgi:hypothetical protein